MGVTALVSSSAHSMEDNYDSDHYIYYDKLNEFQKSYFNRLQNVEDYLIYMDNLLWHDKNSIFIGTDLQFIDEKMYKLVNTKYEIVRLSYINQFNWRGWLIYDQFRYLQCCEMVRIAHVASQLLESNHQLSEYPEFDNKMRGKLKKLFDRNSISKNYIVNDCVIPAIWAYIDLDNEIRITYDKYY